MENGKIKCNLCNEEYSADACKSFTYGRLDVEAIFMGAITWAIIGICYMIYSEF